MPSATSAISRGIIVVLLVLLLTSEAKTEGDILEEAFRQVGEGSIGIGLDARNVDGADVGDRPATNEERAHAARDVYRNGDRHDNLDAGCCLLDGSFADNDTQAVGAILLVREDLDILSLEIVVEFCRAAALGDQRPVGHRFGEAAAANGGGQLGDDQVDEIGGDNRRQLVLVDPVGELRQEAGVTLDGCQPMFPGEELLGLHVGELRINNGVYQPEVLALAHGGDAYLDVALDRPELADDREDLARRNGVVVACLHLKARFKLL